MRMVFLLAWMAASVGADGPLSTAESLGRFQLADKNLVIELVAAEPLVVDPVAISFDERGRMFVAEYRDYPNGPGPGKPPLSRVRLLEDTDGDGKMDKGSTFAEIPFCQGVMAFRGGVLVTAAPDVWWLVDHDNDGKADQRTRMFEGFKAGNPQLRVSHPQWGLDNWVYLSNGLSGGEVAAAATSSKRINIATTDFRFHPLTQAIEPATGFGQFGNTFDNAGHRFFCSNRNPIMTAILPYSAMIRNPYANLGKGYEDVAPSGGDAKVYPIIETQTTAYSHSGTYTAACGVTFYNGDQQRLASGDFRKGESIYVCEPTGHLVARWSLHHGLRIHFRAERATRNVEFLASSDPWCRPVSLANGPDGALYVIDMYRKVIEHPQYMPPGLADKLPLRAGDDKGRIYRVRPKDWKPRPFAAPQTAGDLVKLLDDPNGWRRMLGQRLLVERGDRQVVTLVRDLAQKAKMPGRLNALWTLEGLSSLDDETIELALGERNWDLQEQAVKLAGARMGDDSKWIKRIKDSGTYSERAKLQFALALGETSDPQAIPLLAAFLRDSDAWIRQAVLTSVKDRAGALIIELIPIKSVGPPYKSLPGFIEDLARVVGARGDATEIETLLRFVVDSDGRPLATPDWAQGSALVGLATGMANRPKSARPVELATFLRNWSPKKPGLAQRTEKLLQELTTLKGPAGFEELPSNIQLLAFRDWKDVRKTFNSLLEKKSSPEVLDACVETLGHGLRRFPPDEVAAMLVEKWSEVSPAQKAKRLGVLLSRPETTLAFLKAVEAGKVEGSILSFDQRTALENHSNPKIKSLCVKLFGAPASADRKGVLDKYRAALSRKGDDAKGQAVFKKSCANCHRVDGVGTQVGPDLSDVRGKTPETLLGDIIDPNLAVEPRYLQYIIAVKDGRVLTGLLSSEDSNQLTLQSPDGWKIAVYRSEIESIRSGKSLMPEGVEKDVSVEQMADLLAFLKRPLKAN